MTIVNEKTLIERAALLFKGNVHMQEKWLSAVVKARASNTGWLLDKQIKKIVK